MYIEWHEEYLTFDEDEFLIVVTDTFPMGQRRYHPLKGSFHVGVSLHGHVAQRKFRDSEFQMSLEFQKLKSPGLDADYIDVAISHSPRVKVTDFTSFDLPLSIEYLSEDSETMFGIPFQIVMGGDIRSVKLVSMEEKPEAGGANKPEIIMNIVPNPNRQRLSTNITSNYLNLPPLPDELLLQILDCIDNDFEVDSDGRIQTPAVYIAAFTSFAQVNRTWGAAVRERNFLRVQVGKEGHQEGEIETVQDLDLNVIKSSWLMINTLLRKSSGIRRLWLNVPPPEDLDEELELKNILTSPRFLRRLRLFEVENQESVPGKRKWDWGFVLWWLQNRYLVLDSARGFFLSLSFLDYITTDVLWPLVTHPPYQISSPLSLFINSCYINALILFNIAPPRSWLSRFSFSSSWTWDDNESTKTLFLEVLSKVYVETLIFDGELLKLTDQDNDDSVIDEDGTGPQFKAEDLCQLLSTQSELFKLEIDGGTEAKCCVNPMVINALAGLENLQHLRIHWCIDIDSTSVYHFISHLNQPCNTTGSFPRLEDLQLSVCWSEADRKLLEKACNDRKCSCEERNCPCFSSPEGQEKTWVCPCEQNGSKCCEKRCRCRHWGKTKSLDSGKKLCFSWSDVDDIN